MAMASTTSTTCTERHVDELIGAIRASSSWVKDPSNCYLNHHPLYALVSRRRNDRGWLLRLLGRSNLLTLTPTLMLTWEDRSVVAGLANELDRQLLSYRCHLGAALDKSPPTFWRWKKSGKVRPMTLEEAADFILLRASLCTTTCISNHLPAIRTDVSAPSSKQGPLVTPDYDATFSFETTLNQGTTGTRKDTKRQRLNETSPTKKMMNAVSSSISKVAAVGSTRTSSAVGDTPIKRTFIGRTPTKKSSSTASETFFPQAIGDDALIQSVNSGPLLNEKIGITTDAEVEVCLVEQNPNGEPPVKCDEPTTSPPSLTIIAKHGDKRALISLHELGLSSDSSTAVQASIESLVANKGHVVYGRM